MREGEGTMKLFQRIMIGVDRTDTDVRLLRYLRPLLFGENDPEVRLVHVLPPTRSAVPAALRRQVEGELLQLTRGCAGELGPGVGFAVDVLVGPLHDCLLRHAADRRADLLLVGHKAEHSGRRALARRLAMKAPCSVWMVPEHSPSRLSRVLVPVDFSAASADAMNLATALLARQGGGECVPLHVYFNAETLTYEENDPVPREKVREAFDAFLAGVATHGLRVAPVLREGPRVAVEIERLADSSGADLIVLASRGRSLSASILLGSVAEDVIIDSRRPVLVVKHQGARLGLLRALLHPGEGGELHTN